jgi:methyl-accepting chemotaxis protein
MPNAFLRLQTDFNRAINQFSDSLTLVKSSAANVLSESGEIAEAAQSLARLTEFQSGRLQETTATVMAITSAVQHTATGTKHARKIVASAKDDARHGDTTVQQAVGAMDKIQDSSRQITQIIGVIDEIAFQTNLLALNAGVEAARAGDAGRGFAVVATEVRLLAQRSAGAAREIKNLISMSSNQVLEGVSLVADTGKALERIVTRISEIDVVVTSIDQAGVEQEARLKEVASAVGELEGATRRNMGMAGKIVSASESFSEESRTLDSMLSEFTLAGADANVPPRESEGRAVAKDRPLAELFAA